MGGTGLVIAQADAQHPELAWELAEHLYFDPKESGARFLGTNIVPVMKEAWSIPELDAPNPYYSNQPIGRLYADLAPSTPPRYVTALTAVAQQRLNEAVQPLSRALQALRLRWARPGDPRGAVPRGGLRSDPRRA